MYKLIDDNPEVFIYDKIRKKDDMVGWCDGEEIKVDPFNTDCNIVSVTIHEAIHWFYPDWAEKEVLDTESKIMDTMSRTQYKRIYSKIYPLL